MSVDLSFSCKPVQPLDLHIVFHLVFIVVFISKLVAAFESEAAFVGFKVVHALSLVLFFVQRLLCLLENYGKSILILFVENTHLFPIADEVVKVLWLLFYVF